MGLSVCAIKCPTDPKFFVTDLLEMSSSLGYLGDCGDGTEVANGLCRLIANIRHNQQISNNPNKNVLMRHVKQ